MQSCITDEDNAWPVSYLQYQYTPQHHEQTPTQVIHVCVCVCVVLQCWGVEGLHWPTAEPRQRPSGSLYHRPVCHRQPPASHVYSPRAPVFFFALLTSKQLHTQIVQCPGSGCRCSLYKTRKTTAAHPKDGTYFFNSNKAASPPSYMMQFYVAFTLFKGDVLCSA